MIIHTIRTVSETLKWSCVYDKTLQRGIPLLSEIGISRPQHGAGMSTGQNHLDGSKPVHGEPSKATAVSGNKTNDAQKVNADLEKRYQQAKKKYTYFWKSKDVFSQWHPSKFTVGGVKFTCAEQYMMYTKAKLFGDDHCAEMILKTSNPREMQLLGRQVRQISTNAWHSNCLDVVKDASHAKYTQNKKLKQALFDTYPTVLVEASPFDKIWGIGLIEKDERAWDDSTWEGLNLLGCVLTEVRDELLYKERHITDYSRRIFTPELKTKLQEMEMKDDWGTSMDDDESLK